jgi:hypothetical protein
LQTAIESILSHPIDRFIRELLVVVISIAQDDLFSAPEMTLEATAERHRIMLQRDWKTEAASLFPDLFGPDVRRSSVGLVLALTCRDLIFCESGFVKVSCMLYLGVVTV